MRARPTRGRAVRAALAVAFLLSTGAAAQGCSTLLDIDSDRYVVEAGNDATSASDVVEASATDAANAPDTPDAPIEPAGFACLNDPPVTALPGNLEMDLVLSDVSTASTSDSSAGTPLVGATATACSKLDLACAHPVATATTDAQGSAILMVPGGFDGYYQTQAMGFPPAVLTRPPLLRNELVSNPMANDSTLMAAPFLVSQTDGGSVTQEPGNAIAIVSIFDCASAAVEGAKLTIGDPGPSEQVFYFQDSLPTSAAMSTDSTGSVIIFNVPPGIMSLTATLPSSTQTLPAVSAIARGPGDAGSLWVSYVAIRPQQATGNPPP
jgi:hypothetical protein